MHQTRKWLSSRCASCTETIHRCCQGVATSQGEGCRPLSNTSPTPLARHSRHTPPPRAGLLGMHPQKACQARLRAADLGPDATAAHILLHGHCAQSELIDNRMRRKHTWRGCGRLIWVQM